MRFRQVRHFTEYLAEGLAPEDMVVQSMPDVSPTKWHLAHTSWFFEQFLLVPFLRGYAPLNPMYLYLFNSYYHQAGERHCRDQRGYISRPTVAEVRAYRHHVDEAMLELIGTLDEESSGRVAPLLTLGLHHEQQHQELLLTDIKHVFSVNPLRPAYRNLGDAARAQGLAVAAPALGWTGYEGGLHEIGHVVGTGFAYDNEGPRHRHFLQPFELANRLVTNGEYLAFMEDGGYQRPELWLSMGWAAVQTHGWSEPFYWERREGRWRIFTLSGLRDLDPAEPVCHLNYFEADAYARWTGARLPTEAEWEVAAEVIPIAGNFVDTGALHPQRLGSNITAGGGSVREEVGDGSIGDTLVDGRSASLSGLAGFGAAEPAALRALGVAPPLGMASLAATSGVAEGDAVGSGMGQASPSPRVPSSAPAAAASAGLHQLYGDVWEWTSSPYTGYPGFRPAAGAVGEYNGKFMCNQFVLRGGSCATSWSHIRPTYRNFFPPDASWQFTGVRLARDID
jgi:ergothioneine biosynthesis protein EgtB